MARAPRPDHRDHHRRRRLAAARSRSASPTACSSSSTAPTASSRPRAARRSSGRTARRPTRPPSACASPRPICSSSRSSTASSKSPRAARIRIRVVAAKLVDAALPRGPRRAAPADARRAGPRSLRPLPRPRRLRRLSRREIRLANRRAATRCCAAETAATPGRAIAGPTCRQPSRSRTRSRSSPVRAAASVRPSRAASPRTARRSSSRRARSRASPRSPSRSDRQARSPVAAHTGKEDDCTALVEARSTKFGKVDILVNNAATNPYFGPMLDIERAPGTRPSRSTSRATSG